MHVRMILEEIRIAEGLSVKELSIASGVSQTHIRDIESGRRKPSLETAVKLAHALNKSILEIFLEE